jgi:hypothetical protein
VQVVVAAYQTGRSQSRLPDVGSTRTPTRTGSSWRGGTGCSGQAQRSLTPTTTAYATTAMTRSSSGRRHCTWDRGCLRNWSRPVSPSGYRSLSAARLGGNPHVIGRRRRWRPWEIPPPGQRPHVERNPRSGQQPDRRVAPVGSRPVGIDAVGRALRSVATGSDPCIVDRPDVAGQ